MYMNFTETPNEKLNKIGKVKMNIDGVLADDIPEPLPKKSGFSMIINGPSGSGKTNMLVQILHRRAHNGQRQSLRRVFDDVVIVSPSLKSLANNIFEDLDDGKKFSKFSEEMLDYLDDILDKNAEDKDEDGKDKFTLLILDDVGSQLKKHGRKTEQRFSSLLQNRRHRNLSVITITQKHRDTPLAVRNNLSHYVSFLPKNQQEKEAIYTEFVSSPKKFMNDFFNYFFQEKYDTMFIDMSNPPFIFYRNFNKVEF